jgi:hypothetical protein
LGGKKSPDRRFLWVYAQSAANSRGALKGDGFISRSNLVDNASLTRYPALSLPFGVKKAVERQAKQLDAVLWRGGSSKPAGFWEKLDIIK